MREPFALQPVRHIARVLTAARTPGFMEVFFSKMGVKNLRFKPAYNPYTEPSLEIFSWHEGLGKWVEIGNSGMFRPEMLEPMGLPADVRVLGFGLSLERPTMIRCVWSLYVDLASHSRLTRPHTDTASPTSVTSSGTRYMCSLLLRTLLGTVSSAHTQSFLARQVPLEMIEKSAAVRF